MTDTVRAARLHSHDRPVVIEEVELAKAGADEVLVRLQFGSVNPIDRYNAVGSVSPDGPLPRTLGAEAAGELDGGPVLVAGEGLGSARDGVWAEAAVVPRSAIIPIPDGVAPREAAAMGIAGLTALNVVRDLAQVTSEDRVLVLGASGGVGSMIVSLVDAAQATVWGQTGSSDKADGIVAQGADRVVVAGPAELAQAIEDLRPTVVFDPLGGEFVAPVVKMIEPRGRIVSLGVSAGPQVTFNLQLLYRKMASLLGYGGMELGHDERRAGLQDTMQALRAGELKVPIDEVMPLADINDAFTRLTERGVQGKLLLDLS